MDIARNSLWQKTPFAHLQALPKNGKPIVSDWGIDKEAPYLQIVQSLEAIAVEIWQQGDEVIIPQTEVITPVSEVLTSQEQINQYTDSRDGQTYKTVGLLGKTWLAENLNYDIGKGCWYYKHDPENGKKYGRLYTWDAARRACPTGWRLPNDEEIGDLVDYYGGKEAAYKCLVKDGVSGFNALLSGFRNRSGYFVYLNEGGYYWSAKVPDLNSPYFYRFFNKDQKLDVNKPLQGLGFSVRCLKD